VYCAKYDVFGISNPILYQGAIFIDSEVQTWNLCPVALEQAIVSEIAKGKTKSDNRRSFCMGSASN
jgi:hypothetical protein